MTTFFSNPVNGLLVAVFLLCLMILVVQLAHAEEFYLFTVVMDIRQVDVFMSDNIEEDCNHMRAQGCLLDHGIVLINPFIYEKHGCTLLGHELYHWMGYREHEIPLCERSQEFR